jgi:HK97 gp10 family phage protein
MPSRVESTRARIKLRRVLQSTDNNVKPAMRDAVNLIEKEMRQRAPRDTGNLLDTLSSFVAKNGLRGEVGFRGKKGRRKAFYARFIEFGTKGHKVTAANRSVLAGAGEVFGTQAEIPALPARPFMEPAWFAKKPEVVNRVSKAVNDAIKKASQA